MAVKSFSTKVLKRTQLTPKVLKFELASPAELTYKAGQFASVLVAPNTRRSYSFASLPADQFDLVVDIAPGGPGSIYFEQLAEGAEVSCLAPLGNFLYRPEADYPAYFFATGTGLAPLWTMLIEALQQLGTAREINLLLGFRYQEEIFYQTEIEGLAKQYKNFHYQIFVSRPTESWDGRVGYINQDIEKIKGNIDAYICGGHNMIADTKAKLLAIGVPVGQIYSEQYY